jgi:glycosyltransferase involved in cell wall biosynthesis
VVTGYPRYRVADRAKLKPAYGRRPVLREVENGFEIIRVATVPLPLKFRLCRGLDHFLAAASLLAGALLAGRPEAVLAYSPPLPLGVSAWIFRLLRNVPFAVNVQDIFPRYAVDSGVLRSRALIGLFEALERFVYRQADLIVAHSEGNREYLIRHGCDPSRTVTAPNWSDTELIRPGPRENAVRGELGLDGQFVVSYAGTLGYAQDIDTIVEAAARLKDAPEVAFLLVGDGPEKARVQAKAQGLGLGNVRFLPAQPYERYAQVLQASDACLVNLKPALTTPVVPSKLLNILASGRPVLANLPPEGDAALIVRQAKAGLCLAAGDAAGLAEGVLALWRDPALAAELGRNGRRYAEAHFSRAACAGEYERLLVALGGRGCESGG